MLVLTRKLNESIVIGDNIRLKIVEIRGNKVRLGIEAPSDVRVHRHELLARGVLEFVDAEPAGDADHRAPVLCR